MWVGFLYTFVLKLPSEHGVTRVSKEGMGPSLLLSSIVNWIFSYIRKAEELLKEKTYKIIPTDPTNRQKNKLIQILKKIREEGGLNETKYKKMYPTGAGIPKFYGLPKIHKAGVPLRHIVSSRGPVSYDTAKELARILKPVAGRTTYIVQNTMDFVEQGQNIKLQQDECIISYDVKSLFIFSVHRTCHKDHPTTPRR